MTSKTLLAVEWMREDSTRTQIQAAMKFGLSQSTVSKAINRKLQPKCPTCGHYLRAEVT